VKDLIVASLYVVGFCFGLATLFVLLLRYLAWLVEVTA
jgi:hypothetical protein